MEVLENVVKNFLMVKEKSPLVHHITNYVTVNDCANITLAIGGSPVMADDIREVREMTALAAALVLNIGTLEARTIEAMIAAGQKARELGIPVILDPVGVGATKLRSQTCDEIIKNVKPAVIRGNMSEIKILAGLEVAIKGVDSLADEQDGRAIAEKLARRLDCVIAITGKQDVIADGSRTCLINNGHEILSRVTGTGCMTSSLVGTYCGASHDCFTGAVAGILSMGLAGELAQKSMVPTEGIGTFKVKLFDHIYNLTAETIMREGKIVCE